MTQVHPGSFRDPSGFVFFHDGVLYRQVNARYQPDYDRLMSSGLYARLVDEHLLIPHAEMPLALAASDDATTIIRPERLPFISYPYEWCFSQLRDAALATLRIQRLALEHGMSLKDASAYNIQFHGGAPLLIDTLSFEPEQPGEPWVAYRQFCQHFLAPLALMGHVDIRLGKLQREYLDGIPLDLASALLPWQTRLSLSLGVHLHQQARFEHLHAEEVEKAGIPEAHKSGGMTRDGLLGLLDHLYSTVEGLHWEPKNTDWGAYYTFTNYTEAAFAHKKAIVAGFLGQVKPRLLWDLGANDGTFSRLAGDRQMLALAFDFDPEAVEYGYRAMRENGETALLPLVLDLTNPSPSLGWRHRERQSLAERGPADCVMALALIHHLAIGNNLPFAGIAAFFREIARVLIIEFVPKQDSQIQRMLATREDIFTRYTQEDFEAAFAAHFTIRERIPVKESRRVLYLMDRT